MKQIRFFVVASALALFSAVQLQAQDLSQNLDETTVAAGSSVACTNGIASTSNSYFRSFSMASTTGDYVVGAITMGVELAIENNDGTGVIDGEIPCAINFYWTTPIGSISVTPDNTGTVPNASVDFTIAGDGSQDLTSFDVPITGVTVPDSATTLVVEIFLQGFDSMMPNGDLFFVGANSAGQTGPTFIAAAGCGIFTPTDTAALGFPGTHVLMVVREGTASGCTNPLGDVNLDGVVSLLDVSPFVALLTGGGFQCEADVNEDGVVSLLDVNPFVVILTGG